MQEARGSKSMMMDASGNLDRQLQADPSNVYLKMACAEALVSVMRMAGNANALMCHFKDGTVKPDIRTSDTADTKAVWAELGPRAQRLLAEVEAEVGSDAFNKQAWLFAASLEALMYTTASKGVVAAAMTGNAPAFLLRVSKYEKLHPDWDGCQYCIYWGAYYLAAPWPACSTSKGRTWFERCAEKAPSSRRNQYFLGVGRFAAGDFRGARQAMERALQEPCSTPTEMDIREFLDAEATRTIRMLKDKGY